MEAKDLAIWAGVAIVGYWLYRNYRGSGASQQVTAQPATSPVNNLLNPLGLPAGPVTWQMGINFNPVQATTPQPGSLAASPSTYTTPLAFVTPELLAYAKVHGLAGGMYGWRK